jgi:hypothetical protein
LYVLPIPAALDDCPHAPPPELTPACSCTIPSQEKGHQVEAAEFRPGKR